MKRKQTLLKHVLKNGQSTADKNEFGENSAEYEYLDGTNVVNSVKYANGSKIAYGRNVFNHQVTSVTQSTDSGEGNTTDIIYNYGLPVEVKNGNTVIDYKYDASRRKSSVSINGTKYADYTYTDYSYDSENGIYNLEGITEKLYNDDEEITYSRQVTGVNDRTYESGIAETETLKVNDTVLLEKNYDAKKLLTKLMVKDLSEDVTYETEYAYDEYDNLIAAITSKDSEMLTGTGYEYDEYAAMCSKVISFGNYTHFYSYNYNDSSDHSLKYIGFGSYKFYPLTDYYGRSTGKEIHAEIGKIAGEYISYRKVGDHATNMPSAIWYANGNAIKDNIKYKYDSCGNICEITENGVLYARYAYDALNRLVREDNKKFKKTWLYAYDKCGNITSKREFAFTLRDTDKLEELESVDNTYSYEGDRLTEFNGETISYDSYGNPIIYKGETVEWQYGKRLKKYGATSFAYDGFGRRISKGGITFTYDSDGNLIKQTDGTNTLEFIYDNSGVCGFKHAGENYFYRKDVLGNIIAILDNEGNVVVEYSYDAWGNYDLDGDEALGELNPFRYRGYYYDTETELYYLQTRYYDPEIGRFISQDSVEYIDPEHINGLNLYAYCLNNPILGVDPTGTFVLSAILIGLIAGAVVGAVVGGTVAGVVAYNNGARGAELFGWTMLGIVGGAVIGGAIGAAIGAAAPAIGSAATSISNFLGSTFFSASFAFAGGGSVTISVTYGQAIALASVLVLFASNNRPNNNGVQNKQFRDAAREAGYDVNDFSIRDDLAEVHRYIRKNKLNLGFKELVELIKAFLG